MAYHPTLTKTPGNLTAKRPRWLMVGLCGALLVGIGAAQAQSVYRVVGPDGKVTFSDKPPQNTVTPAARANPAEGGASTKTGAETSQSLPYVLQQAVAKYPVSLYTSTKCSPCDSARQLLTQRGVPFTEKTINTTEDALALQQSHGAVSLPLVTVGGQHVVGFVSEQLNQYLTAAGYPTSSKLPSRYRPAAATPLVPPAQNQPATAKPADDPASSKPPAPPQIPPAVQPPGPTPRNPAGIQF